MTEGDQMGHLALILGDLHIPQRSTEIPKQYKEIITPNKVSAVICTGNAGCKDVYEWMKSLSPVLHIVKGDFQDQSLDDLPQQKVLQVNGLKIGLIHGHQVIPWGQEQALANKGKQLGVSIIISGHTNELKFSYDHGVYAINPGSITGAYSTLKLDGIASFMIMQVKKKQVILYSYFIADGELKCSFTTFPRPE